MNQIKTQGLFPDSEMSHCEHTDRHADMTQEQASAAVFTKFAQQARILTNFAYNIQATNRKYIKIQLKK